MIIQLLFWPVRKQKFHVKPEDKTFQPPLLAL